MIIPDLNLLLYAHDSESPFHARAKRWMESVWSGDEAIGLTHAVVFAFLRIATHPRVFRNPMRAREAKAAIERMLEQPVVSILLPDIRHHELVLRLLMEADSSGGNLVTDAQIAAMSIAYSGVVHTADRDFLRFKGLRVKFPLDA